MHLIILINPGSGTRSKKHFLREVSYQSFDEGWSFEVRSSWYVNNPKHVQRILSLSNTRVVICGGDGTINKVLHAFWQQKALYKQAFLIYPGGTFNALVKNTNLNKQSLQSLVKTLKRNKTLNIDLLEVEIGEGLQKEVHICHTGALFVKDCRFTEHAAQIQKALHQFDFNLGFRSVKKSLPYLNDIRSFQYTEGKTKQEAQGLYIANNPYLITNNPIHSGINIRDGKYDTFKLKNADFFQIGQTASVLLMGKKRDLTFLEIESHKRGTIRLQESVHMNLDGDIQKIKKGTKISFKLSKQKVQLIKYL